MSKSNPVTVFACNRGRQIPKPANEAKVQLDLPRDTLERFKIFADGNGYQSAKTAMEAVLRNFLGGL